MNLKAQGAGSAVLVAAIAGIALALPANAGAISTSCSSNVGTGAVMIQGSPGDTNRLAISSQTQGKRIGIQAGGTEDDGDPIDFETACGSEESRFKIITIDLGDGRDRLNANVAPGTIDPGFGDPPISGFGKLAKATKLIAFGGSDNDRLKLHRGGGVADGGAGKDVIRDPGGSDAIYGGGGGDRIFARDGKPDLIDCGGGNDAIRADRSDDLRRC